MKSSQHYFLVLIILIGSLATAQTTNLGANSGTLGANNTNVGAYAGNSTIAGGNYNSFFGHSAGRINTTGDYNTYLGYYSGYSTSTGLRNSFLGAFSGYKNTTGGYNVFLGSYSGYNNTTGQRNVFAGYLSGYGNTTGRNNSVYGYYAGRFNTTGNNNAFYGYYSGYRNTTGYDNSFYGLYSGYSTNTGYRNTFQGRSSGFRNTTGKSNTIIGYYAGYNNQTGSSNVFIGNQAGYNETGSNKLYIDNSTTANPLIYGDFATDILDVNGSFEVNDTGQQAFFQANRGTKKVSIGTANTPTSIGGANISAYRLFVAGGILTEAIRVRVNWADYVFDNDYNLKPLDEVEQHIKENKHLPNVPSGDQVDKQGIELGDMSRIQQEKIEELFLYTIAQDKEIKKQKELNKTLEERLAKLEAIIKVLETKK